MTELTSPTRPAWQTDELEDEWIDQAEEDDYQATASIYAHTSSDLSLTQPIGSLVVRNDETRTHTASLGSVAGGTFLVRDDVPAIPLLPKTPGRNNKAFGKDFFSPLALEQMFEPPSPPTSNPGPLPSLQTTAPAVPSRLSQVYVPSQDDTEIIGDCSDGFGDEYVPQADLPESGNNDGVMDCQFTFEVPRPSPFNIAGTDAQAQSTPGHPHIGISTLNPPLTDPRLRLFQFQYDTFTRDHLSAMVDSIAINTPSGGSGTANLGEATSPTGPLPVDETSISRLRSAKRIKLSPASDFSDNGDGAAVIFRPHTLRRDYVCEAKSLMEKIRQTRDFSTVSTVASAQSPSQQVPFASPPDRPSLSPPRRPPLLAPVAAGTSRAPSSNWTAASSGRGIYSSLAYREQAANLMAQIRNDMKGSKRLFSGDTEASQLMRVDRINGSITETTLEQTSSFSANARAGKENVSGYAGGQANRSTGSGRGKPKASPRKLLRRSGPTDEAERDIVDGLTNMSLDSQCLLEQFPNPPVVLTVTTESVSHAPRQINHESEPNPALLAPSAGNAPTYPSSSIRSGRNEDLTRFVSSSTASGTTLTTGSTASFVKHPGPKQITRITPEDVPALPDRVGKMVFDKVMMKWVKNTAMATAELPEEDETDIPLAVDGNDSEDPFRDIESLREEDSGRQYAIPDVVVERHPNDEDDISIEGDENRFEEIEQSEVEDEEEAELTSFSFDGPSAELVQVIAEGGEDDDLDITDSEDSHDEEEATETTGPSFDMDAASDDSDYGYDDHLQAAQGLNDEPALQDSPPHLLAPPGLLTTPNPPLRATPGSAPTPNTIRSALKSTSITPVSALKDPNKSRNSTPANRLGHRRSVSFSDGRRDGPILGIGRNIPTPDGTELEDESPSKQSTAMVPSARSKRIADMLDDLEEPVFDDASPSKTSSSSGRPPMEELRPLKPRRPSTAANASSPSREISRRVFSRSHSVKTPQSTGRNANATFLTECSFGVAHDRLVQVITDVEPFEPYWENLTSIDLSKHNIDSVARLKEFLPRLDSLSLNDNHLSWLSGVPGTIRSLSVASNALTGLTSFGHLLNLEHLDISRNQVDSLRQLECLRHLRELRADGNRIDSTDGLHNMDGLVKLSLQGNNIRRLDLRHYRWTRLEMLNLSHNRLANVEGLASLTALIALNFDNNVLGELDPGTTMHRLRILRVSGNRLHQLNASPFPNLRTLYADNNSLSTIIKAYRLTKLENLSLRNQNVRAGLSLSIREVRDVKRLYLSGNPLKPGFISEPCYNLVYLELAACRLTSLPSDLSRTIPNVRVLNLNYNFLEDASPLEGLTRLRKLTIIGSRIKGTKQFIRLLRGMLDIEMLDFRMNPCTLGWYLPLLVQDVPGALQPSDGDRPGPGPTAGARGSSGPFAALVPREDGACATEPSRRGQGHDARSGKDGQHHRRRGASDSHRPSSSSTIAPASAASGAGAAGARAGLSGGDDTAAGSACASSSVSASAPREEPGTSAGVGTGVTTWKDLDAKFRRDLPDEAYVGRLAYRGLVMRACPAIRMLDGVEVSGKERDKAERLLKGVLGMAREKALGKERERERDKDQDGDEDMDKAKAKARGQGTRS